MVPVELLETLHDLALSWKAHYEEAYASHVEIGRWKKSTKILLQS